MMNITSLPSLKHCVGLWKCADHPSDVYDTRLWHEIWGGEIDGLKVWSLICSTGPA